MARNYCIPNTSHTKKGGNMIIASFALNALIQPPETHIAQKTSTIGYVKNVLRISKTNFIGKPVTNRMKCDILLIQSCFDRLSNIRRNEK